jgi:hypothetical protein
MPVRRSQHLRSGEGEPIRSNSFSPAVSYAPGVCRPAIVIESLARTTRGLHRASRGFGRASPLRTISCRTPTSKQPPIMMDSEHPLERTGSAPAIMHPEPNSSRRRSMAPRILHHLQQWSLGHACIRSPRTHTVISTKGSPASGGWRSGETDVFGRDRDYSLRCSTSPA